MYKTGFERYGLSSNPFRDLTSESIDNVDIFHVDQEIDDDLKTIKEELFEKENKAVIAILGSHGVGKTQRLLLVANEAKKFGFFYVFLNMSSETRWTVSSIIDAMIDSVNLSGFQKTLSQPKWYKDLLKARKMVEKKYNPESISSVIVEALNQNTPSCLLLNDLNNLKKISDMDDFVKVLTLISDNIDPGVLIMMSSDLSYFKGFISRYVNLDQRINQKFIVPPLNNNQAGLVLAKRMLEKRMVDNLDPIYPLTEESVTILNKEAGGNARDLLRISGVLLGEASERKAMVVDEKLTCKLLNISENKQLDVKIDKKYRSDLVLKNKKTNNRKEFKFKNIKDVKPQVNTNFSNPGLNSGKDVCHGDGEMIGNPFNNETKIPNDARSVRVKCPKCRQIFTFEVNNGTRRLRCPNPDCDFIGKIKKKN